MALAAEMVVQVDHHGATLHAVLGEPLDAERLRLCALEAVPTIGFLVGRGHDVFTTAETVVEDDLRVSVPIGIEATADVRERVPLGRVLQGEQRDVVTDYVGEARAVRSQRKAEILL